MIGKGPITCTVNQCIRFRSKKAATVRRKSSCRTPAHAARGGTLTPANLRQGRADYSQRLQWLQVLSQYAVAVATMPAMPVDVARNVVEYTPKGGQTGHEVGLQSTSEAVNPCTDRTTDADTEDEPWAIGARTLIWYMVQTAPTCDAICIATNGRLRTTHDRDEYSGIILTTWFASAISSDRRLNIEYSNAIIQRTLERDTRPVRACGAGRSTRSRCPENAISHGDSPYARVPYERITNDAHPDANIDGDHWYGCVPRRSSRRRPIWHDAADGGRRDFSVHTDMC